MKILRLIECFIFGYFLFHWFITDWERWQWIRRQREENDES